MAGAGVPNSKIGGARALLFHYNPFYYMINLVRKPLLGGWPGIMDWAVCGGMLVVGWLLLLVALNHFKPKIPHWV